jgi:hypothetical protein
MYEIKKNIPIPVGDWKKGMYPLTNMEVGDCFDVELAADVKFNRAPISKFEKLNPGFKFLVKKLGLKTHRVWRIPANDTQERDYLMLKGMLPADQAPEKPAEPEQEQEKLPTVSKVKKLKNAPKGRPKKRGPYMTKKRKAALAKQEAGENLEESKGQQEAIAPILQLSEQDVMGTM